MGVRARSRARTPAELGGDQDVVDAAFDQRGGARVGHGDLDPDRLTRVRGQADGGLLPGAGPVAGRARLGEDGRGGRTGDHRHPDVVAAVGVVQVGQIPGERQGRRSGRQSEGRRTDRGDAAVDVVRARAEAGRRAGDQVVAAAHRGAELQRDARSGGGRVGALELAGRRGVGAGRVDRPALHRLEVVREDDGARGRRCRRGRREGPHGVRDGIGIAVQGRVVDVGRSVAAAVVAGVEGTGGAAPELDLRGGMVKLEYLQYCRGLNLSRCGNITDVSLQRLAQYVPTIAAHSSPDRVNANMDGTAAAWPSKVI